MNKTYQTELRRLFLIRDLPEPLVRASSHLQIFDNYIENTRLRLRSMRSPDTKVWSYHLQQRFPVGDDFSHWKIAEIYLNEAEHAIFEPFEGREINKNERAETNEIRKNRYFYDLDGRQIEIDLFLGELWGLNLVRVVFENEKEFENFELPPFVIAEVTSNPFFSGESLVGKKFSDIQVEFARMNEAHQILLNEPDE
ncbi:hypothetical protein BH10ACI1_BH10ACI1_10120 [soil metagenome]